MDATSTDSATTESTTSSADHTGFGMSSSAGDGHASTGEPLATTTPPAGEQTSWPPWQTEPTTDEQNTAVTTAVTQTSRNSKATTEKTTEFPATTAGISTAADVEHTTQVISHAAPMTSAATLDTVSGDDKRHSWCHSVPSWYGISYTLYETARMRYVYYNCGAEQKAGFHRKLPLRMAVCWGRHGWWPPITECPRKYNARVIASPVVFQSTTLCFSNFELALFA